MWMKQIKSNADEHICLVLLGNKCDLEEERVVTKEEGEDLAASYNLPFFESSAKANINI